MDSSDVGGNDRGLRASFLRTFFCDRARTQLRGDEAQRKRLSYDVASHDPPGGAKWREMCVRVFAHVQQRVPSTYRYGPNKTSASEMAQRGTKRVRTSMAEEQEGQYFSPTKRVRSNPTQEEEEEDDEFDTSGSQDVDASQLCTQGETIAMRNSELVVSTDCESSL